MHFHSSSDFTCAQFRLFRFVGVEFHSTSEFGGARFHSACNFLFTFFDSSSFFTSAVFDSACLFDIVEFHSLSYFDNTKFRSTGNFSGAHFHSKNYFTKAVFDSNINFTETHFDSTSDFSGAQFHSTCNFNDARFHSTSKFDSAHFFSTIEFSGAQSLIAYCQGQISDHDTLLEKLTKKGRKDSAKMMTARCDSFKKTCDSLIANYMPREVQISLYEGLLKNFKDRGQTESYEKTDIEYQRFKDDLKPGDFSLQDWWWRYGYEKWRIFIHATLFIVFFSLINFFFLGIFNNKEEGIYHIKYFPEFSGSILGKGEHTSQVLKRLWFSFIYTSVLFFLLSLKIENLKFYRAGHSYKRLWVKIQL